MQLHGIVDAKCAPKERQYRKVCKNDNKKDLHGGGPFKGFSFSNYCAVA